MASDGPHHKWSEKSRAGILLKKYVHDGVIKEGIPPNVAWQSNEIFKQYPLIVFCNALGRACAVKEETNNKATFGTSTAVCKYIL